MDEDEELRARIASMRPHEFAEPAFTIETLVSVMDRFHRTKDLHSVVTNSSLSLGEAQALFQVMDSRELRGLFERFARTRGLGLGDVARPPPPLGELAAMGRRGSSGGSRSAMAAARRPPALPPPAHEFELRVDLFELMAGLALVCVGRMPAKARFLFDLFNLDGSGALEEDELSCLVSCVARAATVLKLAPPMDESELEWICSQAFVDAELAALNGLTGRPETGSRTGHRGAAKPSLHLSPFDPLLHSNPTVVDKARASARDEGHALDARGPALSAESLQHVRDDGGLTFDEFLHWVKTDAAPLCLFEWLSLAPRARALVQRLSRTTERARERIDQAPPQWARAARLSPDDMARFATPPVTHRMSMQGRRLFVNAPCLLILGPRRVAILLESAVTLRLRVHLERRSAAADGRDAKATTANKSMSFDQLIEPAAVRAIPIDNLEPACSYVVNVAHVNGCRDSTGHRVWDASFGTPSTLPPPAPLCGDGDGGDGVGRDMLSLGASTEPKVAAPPALPFKLGLLARSVAHEAGALGDSGGFDAVLHLALPLCCAPQAPGRCMEFLRQTCDRGARGGRSGAQQLSRARGDVKAALHNVDGQLGRACQNGLHRLLHAENRSIVLFCPLDPWLGLEVQAPSFMIAPPSCTSTPTRTD
jgi:hypothetical protein